MRPSVSDVLSSLLPAAAICAYFLVGLAVYAVRYRLRGHRRDAEIESRGSSALLGMWLRLYFGWLMSPIGRLLLRYAIPATAITTLSMMLALGAGVAAAAGHFATAGWLFIGSGICDFFDGRLARMSDTAGPGGAALDSVLDRYSDAAILAGLAWYYRDSWVLLVVIAAIVGTLLVPYVRARGEGLGVHAKVGLMQRPERLVYLGLSVAMAPLAQPFIRGVEARPTFDLAIVGVAVVALLSNATAIHRLLFVLRSLRPAPPLLSHFGRLTTAVRFVLSGAIATAVDFAVVLMLVERAELSPAAATGLGCVVGAVVNFSLNRFWTFRSQSPSYLEAGRYTVVGGASALLNMGGMTLLALFPWLDYRIAWFVVRGSVFTFWNYQLQRSYVFVPDEDSGEKSAGLKPKGVEGS